MKIQCPGCGQQGSISDERLSQIAGKIRCKKCNFSFVPQQAPGSASLPEDQSGGNERVLEGGGAQAVGPIQTPPAFSTQTAQSPNREPDIASAKGYRRSSAGVSFINVLGLLLLIDSSLVLFAKAPMIGQEFAREIALPYRLKFAYDLLSAAILFGCCFGLFLYRNWARVLTVLLLALSVGEGAFHLYRILDTPDLDDFHLWVALPLAVGCLLHSFFILKLNSKPVKARFIKSEALVLPLGFEKFIKDAGRIFRIRRHPASCEKDLPRAIISLLPPNRKNKGTAAWTKVSPSRWKRRKVAWTLGIGLLLLSGLLFLQLHGNGRVMAGLAASPWPEHFVGTWSNEEGEFKTINLGLHADGRGFLNASIFTFLVRWEANETGVLLKATMPMEDAFGQFVEYSLVYNPEQNVLMFPNKVEMQKLKKIADEEPEDLERQVEEGLLGRRKQLEEHSSVRTVSFAQRNDFLPYLPGLFSQEGTGRIEVTISSGGYGAQFRVVGWGQSPVENGLYFFVPVLTRAADSSDSVVSETKYQNEAIPELPIRFRMNESALDALKVMLDSSGIKHSPLITIGKTLWTIETYQEQLQIGPVRDENQLVAMTEFLLRDTFKAVNESCEVSLRTENFRP